MGKTIYKLIDGKLVDINDIPQEPEKEKHFRSAFMSTPRLKWGKPKGASNPRIQANSKGELKWTKGSNNK